MSKRNPQNADLICDRLAEGWTLRQIAREIGYSASKISEWARDNADFGERYARAMEHRWDRMSEEILEISDDGSNDWIERQVGEDQTVTVADHEHIQRSKLRVDSRKWLLSKMMPKKYGDRLTMAGDVDNPIAVEDVTAERAAKRAAAKALLDEAFGEPE